MKASETVELLLEIVEKEVELFHTPDREAYASAIVNRHRENWPVLGSDFEAWLMSQAYARTQDAPSGYGLKQAIAQFKARAIMDGPERSVFLRTAECSGRSYIDLGDPDWTFAEIDDTGWRLTHEAPVRFRRAAGMRPLPRPMRGGNIEELRPFLNLGSDSDWILVLGWLLASLRCKGPFPIAVLQGEQGSAKSTTARVLRSLVDPTPQAYGQKCERCAIS